MPGGVIFAPTVFDRDWKKRGGIGSTKAFAMECGAGSAENATDGALRFAGTAEFAEAPDGALSASWRLVPDSDGTPNEVCLAARFSKRDLAAVVAGGTTVQISPGVPPRPRLLEKSVEELRLVGPDGSTKLRIGFAEKTDVLVQDNQQWGKPIVELRFYFAKGPVEKDREYGIGATFSVPGETLGLAPPSEVKTEAGADWIPYPAPPAGEDWIAPGSALDFSATVPHHEPAGAFGRVVVAGDHFELEGRPGEPIRFCGANIVHSANIPDPASADRFAANLARMGYNSVRIHHHDPFLASPGLANGEKAAQPRKGHPDGLDVPPEAWERFDALVAACIRHGLYVTTDIYVSRYKVMDKSALGLEPGRLASGDYKLLLGFNDSALSNLVAWTRVFLGHVNPLTGRSLAEEPALATIAVVNEGNLGNYGISRLKRTPGMAEAWRAWLEKHPGHGLPPDAPVPDEIYDTTGKRRDVAAFALFLADCEQRIFDAVARVIRDELGCRAPLSSLSSWYYPEQYLLPLSSFDYIDTHFYVDHPVFVGKNWQFPSAISAANPFKTGGDLPGAAWRRLPDRPFCITEWNWASPMGFRTASGLAVGALAARQDWSGIWRFAWSHAARGVEEPGSLPMKYFDLHSDPAQLASERAAICLYLRGDMEVTSGR